MVCNCFIFDENCIKKTLTGMQSEYIFDEDDDEKGIVCA